MFESALLFFSCATSGLLRSIEGEQKHTIDWFGIQAEIGKHHIGMFGCQSTKSSISHSFVSLWKTSRKDSANVSPKVSHVYFPASFGIFENV